MGHPLDKLNADPDATYIHTPRLPMRLNATMPDGMVVPIPIDQSRPHVMTIVAGLQLVVDTWGRTPLVRERTLHVLSSRANNDVSRHARAVEMFVREKVKYLADPDGGEYIQSPAVMLRQIDRAGHAYGDCDDHVVLLGAMLTSIGIPVRVAAVKLGRTELFNHVVLEWRRGDRWMLADPCAKGAVPPFYAERVIVA